MKETLFIGLECLLIGTLIGMWISHKIDKNLKNKLKKFI